MIFPAMVKRFHLVWGRWDRIESNAHFPLEIPRELSWIPYTYGWLQIESKLQDWGWSLKIQKLQVFRIPQLTAFFARSYEKKKQATVVKEQLFCKIKLKKTLSHNTFKNVLWKDSTNPFNCKPFQAVETPLPSSVFSARRVGVLCGDDGWSE